MAALPQNVADGPYRPRWQCRDLTLLFTCEAGVLVELHQRAGVLKGYWDKPLFPMNSGTSLHAKPHVCYPALPAWSRWQEPRATGCGGRDFSLKANSLQTFCFLPSLPSFVGSVWRGSLAYCFCLSFPFPSSTTSSHFSPHSAMGSF